ncbi:MAG TPA: hypothetical protein VIY48_14050 [Candidatus Paceibacterota bacterium]
MTKYIYVVVDSIGPMTAFTDKRDLRDWLRNLDLVGDPRLKITRVIVGLSTGQARIDCTTLEEIEDE